MTILQNENPANMTLVSARSGPNSVWKPIATAPLPQEFGIGIGNEMSQPFASFVPGGLIAALAIYNGASLGTGVTIRKFFTGTSTSDVSFEMEFIAKSDAAKEVIVPVYGLYTVSMASNWTSQTLDNLIANISNFIFNGINSGFDAVSGKTTIAPQVTASAVASALYVYKAPPEVRIQFGYSYTMRNLMVTAMEPKFSSVLDSNGIPMQATVALTATFRDPWSNGSVLNNLPATYFPGFQK